MVEKREEGEMVEVQNENIQKCDNDMARLNLMTMTWYDFLRAISHGPFGRKIRTPDDE